MLTANSIVSIYLFSIGFIGCLFPEPKSTEVPINGPLRLSSLSFNVILAYQGIVIAVDARKYVAVAFWIYWIVMSILGIIIVIYYVKSNCGLPLSMNGDSRTSSSMIALVSFKVLWLVTQFVPFFVWVYTTQLP